MSKKTRKQKIIADLRRQIVAPKETTVPLPEHKPETTPQVTQTQSLYLYPIHLVRKDLTKTLVLCILAISFEIALYFVLERNFVLPFVK